MIGWFSLSDFEVICSGPQYQEPNLPQGVKKKELLDLNLIFLNNDQKNLPVTSWQATLDKKK
jgi:hypothetical protein